MQQVKIIVSAIEFVYVVFYPSQESKSEQKLISNRNYFSNRIKGHPLGRRGGKIILRTDRAGQTAIC